MSTIAKLVPIAGTLEFNLPALLDGLALPEADTLAYFRDGRRAQPLVERRLLHAFRVAGWRCAAAPGGGRKLIDPTSAQFDVRVFAERLSFAPSWMKGVGRDFDDLAFGRYYGFDGAPAFVAGVFVVDGDAFPRCPYWRVDSGVVLDWMSAGALTARASVRRDDLPKLLEGFRA